MNKLALIAVVGLVGCSESDKSENVGRPVRTLSQTASLFYEAAENSDTATLFAVTTPSTAARMRQYPIRNDTAIRTFTVLNERLAEGMENQGFVSGIETTKDRRTGEVLRVDTVRWELYQEQGEWRAAAAVPTSNN